MHPLKKLIRASATSKHPLSVLTSAPLLEIFATVPADFEFAVLSVVAPTRVTIPTARTVLIIDGYDDAETGDQASTIKLLLDGVQGDYTPTVTVLRSSGANIPPVIRNKMVLIDG